MFLRPFRTLQILQYSIHRNRHICYALPHKKIVRIKGPDSLPLLQGLLTNDVTSPNPLIYAYLLNTQGRVLFDLFMYHKDDQVLIELDQKALQAFIKVLSIYKLRKDVQVIPDDSLKCYVSTENCKTSDFCEVDPRLAELGYKIVSGETIESVDDQEYRKLRYKLGVSEGVDDLGMGKTIPLESNGDYLNAISFNKGCYIGQELTARAHHTGVVRKRFMPLRFPSPPPFSGSEFPEEIPISNQKDKKVGTLKGVCGRKALGHMRIKDSLEAELLSLKIGQDKVQVDISIPKWWPKKDE